MRKFGIVLAFIAFMLGVFRDELGTQLTLLLACVFPIAIVVYAFVARKRPLEKGHEAVDDAQSQNRHSKIPVEITKEDIEAYEREQFKELESYKKEPTYNFDD